MTLLAAIAAVQDVTGGLTGIKAAPDNPPESANQFPFAVCYPRQGSLKLQSAGWANYLHTLYVEIHVARVILPTAVAAALAYFELFGAALVDDPTLAGTVSTLNDVRYTFGNMEWGGVKTIGIRFELDVKLLQT